MEFDRIIEDIKKKIYYPIYFLHGEEPYFIDKISKFIEENILSDSDKEFNQSIVYGGETDCETVVSLARQYPMMANYRVLIVREAQNLDKKIEDNIFINSYAKNPVETTILVFDYKYKKIDGRVKLSKNLSKTGVLFESKKLYDSYIPDWISNLLEKKGYRISTRAKYILAENLGNDLNKIENEINKLALNVDKNSEITPELIEKNIGISKDYNVFELQKVLGEKNVFKANRIIHYFASNPKEYPAIMVIGILFSYFKKLFHLHFLPKNLDNNNIASILSVNKYFVNEYKSAARKYTPAKLRQIISLLRKYDLIAKGVESAPIKDGEILKELIFKILH